MTYQIICTTDINPCPPQNQQAITVAESFAALGITPASIAKSISFGVAIVIGLVLIGYGANVLISLIRKL